MRSRFVILCLTLGAGAKEIPYIGKDKQEFIDWFTNLCQKKYTETKKSYFIQELGIYCMPCQINTKSVITLDEWLSTRGKVLIDDDPKPEEQSMPFYGEGIFII
jgi:viroplasmin and RNaseH domain-containing protein